MYFILKIGFMLHHLNRYKILLCSNTLIIRPLIEKSATLVSTYAYYRLQLHSKNDTQVNFRYSCIP